MNYTINILWNSLFLNHASWTSLSNADMELIHSVQQLGTYHCMDLLNLMQSFPYEQTFSFPSRLLKLKISLYIHLYILVSLFFYSIRFPKVEFLGKRVLNFNRYFQFTFHKHDCISHVYPQCNYVCFWQSCQHWMISLFLIFANQVD